MNKSKNLYEGMECPEPTAKCVCGHSAFKSHDLIYPKNRYEPISGKCRFCDCEDLSLE